jgi:hypothetical protein
MTSIEHHAYGTIHTEKGLSFHVDMNKRQVLTFKDSYTVAAFLPFSHFAIEDGEDPTEEEVCEEVCEWIKDQ